MGQGENLTHDPQFINDIPFQSGDIPFQSGAGDDGQMFGELNSSRFNLPDIRCFYPTGKKSYSCQLPNKTFTQSSISNKCIRQVHSSNNAGSFQALDTLPYNERHLSKNTVSLPNSRQHQLSDHADSSGNPFLFSDHVHNSRNPTPLSGHDHGLSNQLNFSEHDESSRNHLYCSGHDNSLFYELLSSECVNFSLRRQPRLPELISNSSMTDSSDLDLSSPLHHLSPRDEQNATNSSSKLHSYKACDKSLAKTSPTLSKHEPYSCQVCDISFSYMSQLIIHNRIHRGKRPYPCQVYGKSFVKTSKLIVPSRHHKEERLHACQECGESFSKSSLLSKHKAVHGIYVCQYCDISFTVLSCLAIHVQSHTGESPYICLVCGKSYRLRRSLSAHKRIHDEQNRILVRLAEKKI